MFEVGDKVHVTKDHSYYGSHLMRNGVVQICYPKSIIFDYEIKRLDGVSYRIGEHWLRSGFVESDFCHSCRRWREILSCNWCLRIACDGCQKLKDGVCYVCLADSWITTKGP